MSKDNQIDEMAKATMKHCKIDNRCGSCHWSTCNECLAEVLYNAGYRKQSDIVMEIFEEIEELIKRTCEKGYCGSISDLLTELKKKYTEKKECPNCRYFVGCEKAVWVGTCGRYEKAKEAGGGK